MSVVVVYDDNRGQIGLCSALPPAMPPCGPVALWYLGDGCRISHQKNHFEDFLFLPFVSLTSWPCWKPGAAHYHGLVSGLQKISVSMYYMSVVVFLDMVHALLAMITES